MTTERKCPDCGCCCDYSSPCCNLKGGNADHPGGCKKITSGNLYISILIWATVSTMICACALSVKWTLI